MNLISLFHVLYCSYSYNQMHISTGVIQNTDGMMTSFLKKFKSFSLALDNTKKLCFVRTFAFACIHACVLRSNSVICVKLRHHQIHNVFEIHYKTPFAGTLNPMKMMEAGIISSASGPLLLVAKFSGTGCELSTLSVHLRERLSKSAWRPCYIFPLVIPVLTSFPWKSESSPKENLQKSVSESHQLSGHIIF